MMASESNPYALDVVFDDHPFDDHLVKKRDRRVILPDEKATLILGYKLVPSEFWPALEYGCFIKIFHHDGGMSLGIVDTAKFATEKGDMVGLHLFTKDGGGGDGDGLKTGGPKSGRGRGGGGPKKTKYWKVAYSDIAELYVRQTALDLLAAKELRDTIVAINHNIKTLTDAVAELARR